METTIRELKPDVFLARCDPSYQGANFVADTSAKRAMRAIWDAMGRDPNNPFRDQLSPGKCAVIKPNWVMHCNRSGGGLDCLITHPTVICWMIQWCATAMLLTGGGRFAPGSWSGNETLWRTTLDLNHLIYFGVASPAHIINVVDGIVAGEGQGPLASVPKHAGVLIAGENPAYVDAAMARMIGYNVSRIPTVYHALVHRRSRFAGPALKDAPVFHANETASPRAGSWSDLENLEFLPPRAWKRAISALPA